MASRKHNPEGRAWKGRSYRKGGERVRDLRDRAKKEDPMAGRYWATFERTSATKGIVTLTDASKGGEWAGAHNVEVKNPSKGLADAAYDSARAAAAAKGGVLDRFTEV